MKNAIRWRILSCETVDWAWSAERYVTGITAGLITPPQLEHIHGLTQVPGSQWLANVHTRLLVARAVIKSQLCDFHVYALLAMLNLQASWEGPTTNHLRNMICTLQGKSYKDAAGEAELAIHSTYVRIMYTVTVPVSMVKPVFDTVFYRVSYCTMILCYYMQKPSRCACTCTYVQLNRLVSSTWIIKIILLYRAVQKCYYLRRNP